MRGSRHHSEHTLLLRTMSASDITAAWRAGFGWADLWGAACPSVAAAAAASSSSLSGRTAWGGALPPPGFATRFTWPGGFSVAFFLWGESAAKQRQQLGTLSANSDTRRGRSSPSSSSSSSL